MGIIQSIILGLVQGLTEFLPVSSSGHLVIFQKLMGLKEAPIFFDTLIHLGTLTAVVFFLRREIVAILRTLADKGTQRLIFNLVLATIPAVAAGLLLRDIIGEVFNSLTIVGFGLLFTSLILFLTKFAKKKKEIGQLSWVDSLFVGIFQAFSILPGVSRSGSTVSAGLYRGLESESAFRFSFLMAIPVILGAGILQIGDIQSNFSSASLISNLIGFVVSVVAGFLALGILEKIMLRGKVHYFSIYCLILGVLVIIFK